MFGLFATNCHSQTLGGAAAYSFLKLPASPLLTSLGGVNTSYNTNEVSLTANNPALLNGSLHGELATTTNFFLAGIKAYSLTGAVQKKATSFGGHIYFVNYGEIPATDAAGNGAGTFRPVDFVVQVSAAKKYLEKWTYGVTLKFIQSSYRQFSSAAVAADVGLLYADSARDFSASLVIKNAGGQLTTYAGEGEDLPFDLQIGFTKRLAKAPFAFSVTANHLHQFDLVYNDTLFAADNGFARPSSLSKIVNHFTIATHIYLGANLEASIGYNRLRRQELSIPEGSNGLTGFSAGLRIKFNKLQLLYARSAYQRGISYNQIGITINLKKLVNF